uniref:Protein-kinase, interferon-inducible double stranded RNA dependent inhibitor, repressor of (P58 repressor) a n=1 Tax=Nothobranchius furzeri TaxID=105023 RepID=A0A1A8UGH6_NOTFU
MQSRCAVPSCPGGKADPQPLFRFPQDPQRCQTWAESCQGTKLGDKPVEQLYRNYRLCGKHFEASAFDTDAPGKVLKDDAVPTIFDPPAQPKTGQVKRGKETPKDEDVGSSDRKRIKKPQAEAPPEETQNQDPEDDQKKYLKSLFEVVLLLGEQGIPLSGATDDGDKSLKPSTFQALLDYRINCGDEVLRKRYDSLKPCCFTEDLSGLLEVCEEYVRSKVVEDVIHNGFFSLLTEDPVKISGQWCLPVFLRYVDPTKCQQERFVGFLAFKAEEDDLAETMLSELVEKWGVDMEQCRGQAHSCSGPHFSKIKAFAAKVTEKYPKAVLTFRSTHSLNVSLVGSMAVSGVRLVVATFKKIESFFRQSPLMQQELDHAISIFYPDKEDKAKELKEICKSSWTKGHDAFEVALEVIEALLLCVDSIHDNEDMRWNDQVTHSALEISKALTDFELIMALVVLKNVIVLTQAFGKNLQGNAADAVLAAVSLKAVLRSLKEMSDNIDVYHEFWYDEAVNIAAAMEIPVRVPRSFSRKYRGETGSIQPDGYYKDHLSVPVLNHVIKEMNELFCENHLKALRCLSLLPEVIAQNKSTQPEEGTVELFKEDIPNAGTLSAELHCWLVKWSKKGKGETFPSSLCGTMQLADVKFFPNMFAILSILSVLPSLAPEDSCDVAYKRFKVYLENTPDKFRSKSLALLNISYDVDFDLDTMVEMHLKMFPAGREVS